MAKHKRKFRRKDMLAFLSLLRDCIKRETVLTDEEDLPTQRGETGGLNTRAKAVEIPVSSLPSAVLYALKVADEFTSGVNGDIDRLRTAVRTALDVVGSRSVSSEAPVADLNLKLQRSRDYDIGFQLAAENGYDGPPPAHVTFADAFEEGQQKGLKRWEEKESANGKPEPEYSEEVEG